jgi:hypothetical protein
MRRCPVIVRTPQSCVPTSQPAVSAPQSVVSGPQSAVHASQSAVSAPQSAVSGPQSAVHASQSAVSASQSAAPASQSAVHASKSTVSVPLSVVSALHSAVPSPQSAVPASRAAVSGLQSVVSALHSTVQASQSAVFGPQSAGHASQSAVSVPQSAVHASQSAVPGPQSAVHASQSAVSALHSAVSGPQSAVHASQSAVSVPVSVVSALHSAVSNAQPAPLPSHLATSFLQPAVHSQEATIVPHRYYLSSNPSSHTYRSPTSNSNRHAPTPNSYASTPERAVSLPRLGASQFSSETGPSKSQTCHYTIAPAPPSASARQIMISTLRPTSPTSAQPNNDDLHPTDRQADSPGDRQSPPSRPHSPGVPSRAESQSVTPPGIGQQAVSSPRPDLSVAGSSTFEITKRLLKNIYFYCLYAWVTTKCLSVCRVCRCVDRPQYPYGTKLIIRFCEGTFMVEQQVFRYTLFQEAVNNKFCSLGIYGTGRP